MKKITLKRSHNTNKRRIDFYTRILENKFRKKKWIKENNLPNVLYRLNHPDESNISLSLEEAAVSVDVYKRSRQRLRQVGSLGNLFIDPVLISHIITYLINEPIYKKQILFDIYLSKFLIWDREFCIFVFPPTSHSFIKSALDLLLKIESGKIEKTRSKTRIRREKNKTSIMRLLNILCQASNWDLAMTFNVSFPFLCFWIAIDCEKCANFYFRE